MVDKGKNLGQILNSIEAMNLIKNLFLKACPQFIIEEEIDRGTYAYWILYKHNDWTISFGCEKGYFSHKIVHNEQDCYLFSCDNKLRLLPMTYDNILYAFGILHQFLIDRHL